MSVHGPVIPYKLSAEELAEYDRNLGKPTKPLNRNKAVNYAIPSKQPAPKKTCSWDGCNEKYYAKGYCSVHYHEAKKGMKNK
jgi:hypothetical protein